MEKAVFFDLDGTVLDTQQDIADCMNMAIVELGYEPRTYAEYRKVIGNDAPNFVRKLLGDMPEEKLMYIWNYYIPFVEKFGTLKSKVFANVPYVIKTLKEKGFKVVLFTNKTPDELQPFKPKFLDALGFDLVVGVGGTDKAKPSPKAVLEILSNYKISPENSYIVGDGETDMMTAVNGALIGVGVLWGNRDERQLIESGAKHIAKTPIDLLEIIK